MIYLSFRFEQPLVLFTLIFIGVLSGLWAHGRFKEGLKASFVPVVIFNFLALGIWALVLGLPHDEAEHLHLSWLVSQGMIPYKDFWQHHSPFLWMIAAPFIKNFIPSVEIISISRIVCGMVLALDIFLGWRIARVVWGREARFIVYILVISSVLLSAQFLIIRPDVFMLFFLLLGIRFSLDVRGKSVLPGFFAGMAFTLAFSFMIKQYFLVLIPVAAIFMGEKGSRPMKLLSYVLGLAVGAIPLACYLIDNGIVRDFMFWVLGFNGKRVIFSAYFPIVIAALGAWGAAVLLKKHRDLNEQKSLILFMTICLSTLSSLTMTSLVEGSYYLAFWFFMSAIVASGCDLSGLFEKIPSLKDRAIVFGICASLLMGSTISNLMLCRNPAYSIDRDALAELMDYCAGDNCLAFLQAHPLFSHDTTRLYSLWQYSFVDENPAVRNDLKQQPMARQIMASRPALVLSRYSRRDLLLDFFQKGLISAVEYKELVAFFKENYTPKRIGKKDYYLRKDLL